MITHRMWGFPEIPENLKWIVMTVLAAASCATFQGEAASVGGPAWLVATATPRPR